MTTDDKLMTVEERITLEQLSALAPEDAQRLQALLLIDDGATQASAASEAGLTKGQVNYALRKFRKQRTGMFVPPAEAVAEVEMVDETEETEIPEPPESTPIALGEDSTEVGEERVETVVAISPQQFRAMMAELNKFADRIQEQIKFSPPPFSPDEMLDLMQKLTPERLTIINDMQSILANRPDAKDMFDPDTWRGMWFILTYTAQNESKSLFDKARDTVKRLPGVSLGVRTGKAIFNKLPGSSIVTDVLGMLEGASPKDLLDPQTWRGMIYLINYSLQYELEQIKERVLGADTAVDEDDEDEVTDLAVE